MAEITPSHARTDIEERHYGLDWLRLIAFALLIFYHVGMFYVPWFWHVKSNYASPAAEPLMNALNPWRLALLFFISGVALRFAVDKMPSALRFALSRSLNLGLPLMFGVLVLVMPQSYFQLRQSGEFTGSILEFYPHYLRGEFSVFTPTWNHLWYIAYLLAYTLVILPLAPLLRQATRSRAFRSYARSPAMILLLTIVPFMVYEATVMHWFPITDDFIHDWGQHTTRLTMVLIGFLAAKDRCFWESIDRLVPATLVLAVALYGANAFWMQLGLADSLVSGIAHLAIQVLYAWTCILAMLGLGQRYLNRPSKALRYLTGAIFCYYVVHQTITVVAGYYLTELHLGVWTEFALLTAITACGCVVSYEVGRRIGFFGIFIGIRQPARPASKPEPVAPDLPEAAHCPQG